LISRHQSSCFEIRLGMFARRFRAPVANRYTRFPRSDRQLDHMLGPGIIPPANPDCPADSLMKNNYNPFPPFRQSPKWRLISI
jgi:hypothetical protein